MFNPWAVRRFVSALQMLFLFGLSVIIIYYASQIPETDPHRTLKIFGSVIVCGVIWTVLCVIKLIHAVKQVVREERDKKHLKEIP